MRILVVLISSTATHQVQNNRNGRAAIAASNAQKGKKNQTSTAMNQGQKGKKAQTSNAAYQTQKAKKNQTLNQAQTGKAARGGEVTQRGKATAATTTGKTAKGKTAQVKPVKPQHFNLAKQPNTAKAPRVKFQQGRRIAGSQNWQGQQYTVFRNYKSEWHDQNWWRGHYRNNITFVFGAPYYWNAGYWFPAWGYNPNAYYAWDGPISGNCECAGGSSAARLLPWRSGWSYWTAHAWCDRRLSAQSRALHHIHDRSANTSIARHDVANQRADFRQKPPPIVSTAAFVLTVSTAAFCHRALAPEPD